MPSEVSLLTLHVYIEVEGLPDALEQARKLCDLTNEIGPAAECHVERYWKIPQYYGIVLPLTVSDEQASLQRAKDLLGERWEVSGTGSFASMIWDHRWHGTFALPPARWCHLQLDGLVLGAPPLDPFSG